jgi:hypothetical protein
MLVVTGFIFVGSHYACVGISGSIALSLPLLVVVVIADKIWTMVDSVKMLEREEGLLGGRLTAYKPNMPKKRAY